MIIILSVLIPFSYYIGVAANFKPEWHNILQHTLYFITTFMQLNTQYLYSVILNLCKLALISLRNGSRSVGIVCSQTQAMEFRRIV
jgi:hypothetical protein